MTDLLAIVREGVLSVYAMNGNGAATELAQLRLADTSTERIATVLEGLRPFLIEQAAPAPARKASPRKGTTSKVPAKRRVNKSSAPVREAAYAFVEQHPGSTTREVMEGIGRGDRAGRTGAAMTRSFINAGLRFERTNDRGKHGTYSWYVDDERPR